MEIKMEQNLHQEQETLLQLSCYSIEGQLKEGSVQGTFSFSCEGERPIKGKVIATDPRIKCEPSVFQGKEIEISYCFYGSKSCTKEAISGSFLLITNYGEYEITYCFEAKEEKLDSSMGEIKNLFHFTNLAKTNWEEALKLYFSPAFSDMLKKSAEQYLTLYQGLSGRMREQYMEEFLQAVNKKKPVYYELQEPALLLSNLQTGYKEDLCIYRNGWGYTYLEVTAEGEFLSVEKKVIREEDFMGNMHRMSIYVDPTRLHQGKNWGEIILHSPYETIRIPVQVYQNEHHRIRQAMEKRRNAKWLNLKLTEIYLNFRSKSMGSVRFKKEGEEILEALVKSDDRNPLTKLYGAHLYITQEKFHEAKWLLDRAGKIVEEEKNPVVYAYYLYLTTLITADESYVREVRQEIEKLHYAYENLWQISWLYMYLEKSLRQNPQKKWEFLHTVFQRGCNSPVMYMEALLLFNYQPTLLMELSPLELRILGFGIKRNLLSQEVKGVVSYLARKEKEYNPHLCFLLQKLVDTDSRSEFLQALCSQLIKGNKKGEAYAKWYEKAILSEIKLTRLYEYYMMSLDLEKDVDLPRMVLLYFSYQQDIKEEYGAYIYRYIYQNREQMEDLYLAYIPKIERFLLRKLHSGKMNRDLGYLYEHLLYPKMITEDNARALAKMIFYHKIPKEKIKAERLIVVHKQLKQEQVYLVSEGLQNIEIYNSSYLLFWEDDKENRYVEKTEDLAIPYLNIGKMAQEVGKWVADERGLALFFCQDNTGWQTMNWKMEAQFQYLRKQEWVKEEIKKRLGRYLLDFYYENDAMERLDQYLESMTPQSLSKEDRNILIRYFVLRDYYHLAYEFLKEYGPYEIEPKALVRITTAMLEEDLGEEDILCWYIYTAFLKGKYNGIMLKFLVRRYQGTSKRLRDIFYRAKEFDVDTYGLSERILRQILSTRAFIGNEVEIFKNYIVGGAKTELEGAFLTYRSIGYLRDDREIELYLIKDMERVFKRGESLPLVTHIAYLRFWAENKEWMKDASKELLYQFLEELLVDKGMKLPFLQEYAWLEGMEHLAEKTMLCYKTNPKAKVMLHYRKIGGREEEAFRKEELKEVYFGTYVKDFILFCSEEIQYYITESWNNQEQLTGSGSLVREEIKEEKSDKTESRYQMIHEMTIAASLRDYTSLDQILEEYWKSEFIAKQVFHL